MRSIWLGLLDMNNYKTLLNSLPWRNENTFCLYFIGAGCWGWFLQAAPSLSRLPKRPVIAAFAVQASCQKAECTGILVDLCIFNWTISHSIFMLKNKVILKKLQYIKDWFGRREGNSRDSSSSHVLKVFKWILINALEMPLIVLWNTPV